MKRFYTIILLSLLLPGACTPEKETVPSYISIDAVVVDRGNDASWSHKDQGFFTNLIDAVNITYWVKGDKAWTTLGVFQLPCHVPVLREGQIDTLVIEPVVKQNGISSSRIYYPYYKPITHGAIVLTPDQTLSLDTLHTTYKSSNTVKVAFEEYFTLTSNIQLDTVVRLITNHDTVRSGSGCGVIRVKKDQKAVNFWSHDTLVCKDPSAYLYLEMDYWTDFDLSVGFNNPSHQGGSNQIQGAMTLYRNNGWQKIYINLGKLWAWYNHYPYLRLYFTVLNGDGREGNVYLDNIKVVMM